MSGRRGAPGRRGGLREGGPGSPSGVDRSGLAGPRAELPELRVAPAPLGPSPAGQAKAPPPLGLEAQGPVP